MDAYFSDTITAIATPPGEGGVGIVRISGPDVWAIADRVFAPLDGVAVSARKHGTFAYGKVLDAAGGEIDTGLALIMRAPRSYTCEDVVEIQGHGGSVGLRRILRRILEAGARMAEPGEFTKRAFLNGRIDLLQAEGILDLIRAQSDRAASAALEQMEGQLSQRFNAVYDAIMEVAANVETTLDFIEDELPDDVFYAIEQKLLAAQEKMDQLMDSWDEGRLLREGARVVILGRPNAGKSTLLNVLLGFERAIVSNTAGTTRDTLEESFVLDGIPLRIIDTAGLRETDCEIEAEGIRRAEAHRAEAHISIYLIDVGDPLHVEDQKRLRELDPKRCVVVLNKTDIGAYLNEIRAEANLQRVRVVEASLTRGDGVEALKREMAALLEHGYDFQTPPHAVISERHRQLLLKSRDELKQAGEWIHAAAETHAVLVAEHLRASLEHLGLVTGRVYHDELLENIFSRFCIGK